MGVKLGLILREEHRLRVLENGVLRRKFGCKREEVAGGCRRLHNEELNNMYTLQNVMKVIKSSRIRWAEHVAHIGEIRNAYKMKYTFLISSPRVHFLEMCETSGFHGDEDSSLGLLSCDTV
jgi:hypothetical protein